MPIYLFQHPETEEIKEVIQGMNDEHVFEEAGVKWQRLFTVPQGVTDTQIDPFSQQQFIEKTGKNKGTIGDVWERSAELSAKRAGKRDGSDPIKNAHYEAYAKAHNGNRSPHEIKEKIDKLSITI